MCEALGSIPAPKKNRQKKKIVHFYKYNLYFSGHNILDLEI
jgi:hypothetical protein